MFCSVNLLVTFLKKIMANEKLRNACFKAFETFQKINDDNNAEIQAKLGFVVGSYDFDQNPVGLYEIGGMALPILKKIKEKNTKKVTKQLITELEKALAG